MIKQIIILQLFVTLLGCSSALKTNNNPRSINTHVISQYAIAEDYFINNYSSYKLQAYKKPQKIELYNAVVADTTVFENLNKNDVFNLLGVPSLVKVVGDIEIWQYRNNNCILNVIWNDQSPSNMITDNRTYTAQSKPINFKQCFIAQINSNLKP